MNNKLYRSNYDKVLLGTLGGIAEYFNVNSTIVRILFLLIIFTGDLFGVGVFLYLISPLFIPTRYGNWYEDRGRNQYYDNDERKYQYNSDYYNSNQYDYEKYNSTHKDNKKNTKSIMGIALVLLGILLLVNRYIDLSYYFRYARQFWPVLLIIFGIYILVSDVDRD